MESSPDSWYIHAPLSHKFGDCGLQWVKIIRSWIAVSSGMNSKAVLYIPIKGTTISLDDDLESPTNAIILKCSEMSGSFLYRFHSPNIFLIMQFIDRIRELQASHEVESIKKNKFDCSYVSGTMFLEETFIELKDSQFNFKSDDENHVIDSSNLLHTYIVPFSRRNIVHISTKTKKLDLEFKYTSDALFVCSRMLNLK